MREIKFRLYDELKGMVDVDLLPLPQPNGKEKRPLMQFTGLFDCHGKEIYEGDILDVKFNTGYVQRIYWKGEPDARAVVFWDFAGFRLKCKGKEDERYADWADTDGYFDPILDMERSESEIIGNIYENPDLLTQKP